ncbi:MAG TPA: tetratricopeptide repeat protein, partial [Nitrosopumilus sp.]|nr:tetratricopeptide repeat protein [Nitrosopumilus sp.]
RALFNKGNALANLKKFEESIECFNQVIKKNPEYPFALRYKGVALKKLGR